MKQITQKLSNQIIPTFKSNNRTKQQQTCQISQNQSNEQQELDQGNLYSQPTALTNDNTTPKRQLSTHSNSSNDHTPIQDSSASLNSLKTNREQQRQQDRQCQTEALLEPQNVDENNNNNDICEPQHCSPSRKKPDGLKNELNEFEAKLKLLEDPKEDESSESRRDSIKSCLRSPSNDGSPKRRLSVKFADESGYHLTKTLSFENFDHLFSIEVPHQNTPKLFSPIKKMRRFIPQFQLSSNNAGLAQKVADQKVTLESVHIFGTMVSGSVLVEKSNIPKKVSLRFTLDNWKSWKEFMAVAATGQTSSHDRFEFEQYFEPAEIEQTVEFCIKYENSFGEYWDNNFTKNYSMKLD